VHSLELLAVPDGYEATRAIRSREEKRGRRTPIVAMIAHSMRGDRERSPAAGMDDYPAKPLGRPAFGAAPARWTPGPEPTQTATAAVTSVGRAGEQEPVVRAP
jgi:CheY-like chemotaxis protein